MDDNSIDRGYVPPARWGYGLLRETFERNHDPMNYNQYRDVGTCYASSSQAAPPPQFLPSLGVRHQSNVPAAVPSHVHTEELYNNSGATMPPRQPRPPFHSNLDMTASPPLLDTFVQDPEMVVVPVDNSSDEDIPSKRNIVRRQNRAYLQEMRNVHAEGRRARHVVHTDALGEIIDQKSLWHRAVRALARTELDWKIKSYKQHPEAWSYITKNIQKELNKMFVFVSTPVKEGYLEKYLSITISKDCYEWRKH